MKASRPYAVRRRHPYGRTVELRSGGFLAHRIPQENEMSQKSSAVAAKPPGKKVVRDILHAFRKRRRRGLALQLRLALEVSCCATAWCARRQSDHAMMWVGRILRWSRQTAMRRRISRPRVHRRFAGRLNSSPSGRPVPGRPSHAAAPLGPELCGQALPGGRIKVTGDVLGGSGNLGLADPGSEMVSGIHAQHIALGRTSQRRRYRLRRRRCGRCLGAAEAGRPPGL
jgi:hypothetical protein